MYGNGESKSINSLTRLSKGLAFIALTVTIFAPQLVVAQDKNLIAKVSQKLPVVESAALSTNIGSALKVMMLE